MSATVIDMTDPQARRYVLLCQLIGRLRIEINTGMSSRVSSLKVAQEQFDIKSRTKKGALADLIDIRNREYPQVGGN
jgi:hypothetical protein